MLTLKTLDYGFEILNLKIACALFSLLHLLGLLHTAFFEWVYWFSGSEVLFAYLGSLFFYNQGKQFTGLVSRLL